MLYNKRISNLKPCVAKWMDLTKDRVKEAILMSTYFSFHLYHSTKMGQTNKVLEVRNVVSFGGEIVIIQPHEEGLAAWSGSISWSGCYYAGVFSLGNSD